METRPRADSKGVPDRAIMNANGRVELTNPVMPGSPTSATHHSLKDSLDERRHSAGVKLRKVLHISKPSDTLPTGPILAHDSTAKSHRARLGDDLPDPKSISVDGLLHHPIDTIKEKISAQSSQQTAANIATKEISHGQEVDLVKADDRVEFAATATERAIAVEERDALLRERQNIYVRWTLDRHVTQCRVMPKNIAKRDKSEFEYKTLEGDIAVDWKAYAGHLTEYYAQQYGGQYVGYGSSPPALTKESIMPNVERIIIASAPFQRFIMKTREVYRWEDPTTTTTVLLIYMVLVYYSLLLPASLSGIVYLILRKRLFSKTLEDVRTDLERTEDQRQTPLDLTEFIEKQGDGSWLEKLQEVMGPWVMVQLADAANMFEILRNFYEWRVPDRTMATLLIFALGIIVTTFVPTYVLVKSAEIGAGFAFFGLFPLASNFPDYRLLASVPRRVFWNIPTHAEWAIKSLQDEGTHYQQNENAGLNPVENKDYGTYPAHLNGDKGRLVVSARSIRFETNIGHKVVFVLNYDLIYSLEKVERFTSKMTPVKDSGKDLRITSKLEGDREWLLKDMDDGRDQAFSQIVGFSKTSWQVAW
ncbi:hypothetical protein E4T44_01853 [Aureobasidium sp. EXF-8845]|nr:hypothetical protein E4T44_01853 [Aureobasidium sp. EXF-8845]KAI4856092.1 hypothetical protein E4T45_02454 [Aureobasidium sp. EXF-8846]